ncbi:ribonuclease P 40kDa subunit-domain-containing protein, partial [Phellopilus nigrolimitatus]
LEEALGKINGSYKRGRVEIHKALEAACTLTGKYSSRSDLVALSTGSIDTEDAWCIDHRGVLTLSLTKQTYHELGVVGEKQSKRSDELVQIDLYDCHSRLFHRAKEAFRLWDERRTTQGVGPWEVLFQGSLDCEAQSDITMTPIQSSMTDVNIPHVNLKVPKYANNDAVEKEETTEDWHENISELFEWVGMACIRYFLSRLKANDRANPYVAVYEPPSPNKVGNISHFSWRGFLPPSFTRIIIETAVNVQDRGLTRPEFITLTANTFSDAPLSHVSPKAFAEGAKIETRQKRPGKFVHCWSLLANTEHGDDSDDKLNWVLATLESPV